MIGRLVVKPDNTAVISFAAIDFVSDYADLGVGQGGYNEDHEFYGYRMPI
ncbi:MAG: hypothetical protein JO121_06265 [Deltaproteobacteria bacterium]|nr:hypothetical protein [Deltaproteobacteria bacterium]